MFSVLQVLLLLCIIASNDVVQELIDEIPSKLAHSKVGSILRNAFRDAADIGFNRPNIQTQMAPKKANVVEEKKTAEKDNSKNVEKNVAEDDETPTTSRNPYEPVIVSDKDTGSMGFMKLRGDCPGETTKIGDEVHDWCDVTNNGKKVVERCTEAGWKVVYDMCATGWNLRFVMGISRDPTKLTLSVLKSYISNFKQFKFAPREISFEIVRAPGVPNVTDSDKFETYKPGQKLTQELVGDSVETRKLEAEIDHLGEMNSKLETKIAVGDFSDDYVPMEDDDLTELHRRLLKVVEKKKSEHVKKKKRVHKHYHPKLEGAFRIRVIISPEFGRAKYKREDLKVVQELLSEMEGYAKDGTFEKYIMKKMKMRVGIDPESIEKYYKIPPEPKSKGGSKTTRRTTTRWPIPDYMKVDWNTPGPNGEKPRPPIPVPSDTKITLKQTYDGITDCAAKANDIEKVNAKALSVPEEDIKAEPGAGCSSRSLVRRHLGSSVTYDVVLTIPAGDESKASRIVGMSAQDLKDSLSDAVFSDSALGGQITVQSCEKPKFERIPLFCSGMKKEGACFKRKDCKWDRLLSKCDKDPDATPPPSEAEATSEARTTSEGPIVSTEFDGSKDTIISDAGIQCIGTKEEFKERCAENTEKKECESETSVDMSKICKWEPKLPTKIIRKVVTLSEEFACSKELNSSISLFDFNKTKEECTKDLECMGFGKQGNKMYTYDIIPYADKKEKGSCYSLNGVRLPPPERKGEKISGTKSCKGAGELMKATTIFMAEHECGNDEECEGYSEKGGKYYMYDDFPEVGTDKGSCYKIKMKTKTAPTRSVVVVSNKFACVGKDKQLDVITIEEAEQVCQDSTFCKGFGQNGNKFFGYEDDFPQAGEESGLCFQVTSDGVIVTTQTPRYSLVLSAAKGCASQGKLSNATSIEIMEKYCFDDPDCKGFGFNLKNNTYYMLETPPKIGTTDGSCYKIAIGTPEPTPAPIRVAKMVSLVKACSQDGRMIANTSDLHSLKDKCIADDVCQGYGFKFGFYYQYDSTPLEGTQPGICYKIALAPPPDPKKVQHATVISKDKLCAGNRTEMKVPNLMTLEDKCMRKGPTCLGFGVGKDDGKFYSFSMGPTAGTVNGTCYKTEQHEITKQVTPRGTRTIYSLSSEFRCKENGTRMSVKSDEAAETLCLKNTHCRGYSAVNGTYYTYGEPPSVGTTSGTCNVTLTDGCYNKKNAIISNNTAHPVHTTCPPTTTIPPSTTLENFTDTTGEWTTPAFMAEPTMYPSAQTTGSSLEDAFSMSDEIADSEIPKSFLASDWVFYPLLSLLLITSIFVTYYAIFSKEQVGDQYEYRIIEETESTFAFDHFDSRTKTSCLSTCFTTVRSWFELTNAEPYGNFAFTPSNQRLTF